MRGKQIKNLPDTAFQLLYRVNFVKVYGGNAVQAGLLIVFEKPPVVAVKVGADEFARLMEPGTPLLILRKHVLREQGRRERAGLPGGQEQGRRDEIWLSDL